MSRNESPTAGGTPALAPNRNPNPAGNAGQPLFDHEKLEVYQEAIAFCAWAGELLETLPKVAAKDQLDRASTSIPLNIAEGNGKFSPADRSRYFEIARGSAVECAACLDVLVARKLAPVETIGPAKRQLAAIVRMLIGLLKRFSSRADVLHEESGVYPGKD
jgi:four helix bundle protein